MKPKLLNLLANAVVVVSIILASIIGVTMLDKLLDFIVFLTCGGIFILFVKSILNALDKNYTLLMIFFILITLMFSSIPEIGNILMPFVDSELITLDYDLSSSAFDRNGQVEITEGSGQYVIERIEGGRTNRYRIRFPKEVNAIGLFYSSYEGAPVKEKPVIWAEGTDFVVKDGYIESHHDLNEAVNNGRGRYIIQYNRRITFSKILRHSSKYFAEYMR